MGTVRGIPDRWWVEWKAFHRAHRMEKIMGNVVGTMRLKWNGVSEYVESGVLTSTVMEDGQATKHSAKFDLRKIFPEWEKMAPVAKYAGGNGVKQIVVDGVASVANAVDRVALININFAELVAGTMPGTGSKLSITVSAIARVAKISDEHALVAWDAYSDAVKKEKAAHPQVVAAMADIREERATAEKKRLAELAKGEEIVAFAL